MPRYARTIDYETKSSKEELTRRQGNYPPQGGGGTPIVGEQHQGFMVSGNTAWNLQGNNPVPAFAAAEQRQLYFLRKHPAAEVGHLADCAASWEGDSHG